VKLQVKPNGQAVITVPKRLRKAKNWDHKKELNWELNSRGNLELIEK